MPIANINTNTTLADVLTNDPSTDNISIESPSGEMLASITDDSADLSSSGGLDGQYGTISTNKDRTQIEFGDDNAGGFVNITNAQATIGHDNEVRVNSPSFKKNGIDVATINDITSVVVAYAQPLDSDLTAIAALSTTSFGRDFLALTNTAFESLFKPVWSPLNIAAVLQHTGDTNETVITTTGKDMVGKLVSGDVVSFNFGIQASNNANAKTFRIYVSDSPSSLLNQTLIATATTNAGAINTIEAFKYMNLASLTTQMVISGTGTNAATGPNMGTTSIDFSTGNKYIVVTIQLAVGTDTAKLQWFRSQVNR